MRFLRRVGVLLLGGWLAMGKPAFGGDIPFDLVQKGHPFLKNVQVLVLALDPRRPCREGKIQGGFIPGTEQARNALLLSGILKDQKRNAPECNFEWRNLSLYAILRFALNGVPFAILDSPHAAKTTPEDWMDYGMVENMIDYQLPNLKLNYYLINGQREQFIRNIKNQKEMVYPYYLSHDLFKPVHIARLQIQQPNTKLELKETTLAQFFAILRTQPANESHEIWELTNPPEFSLSHLSRPVDFSTAPEYAPYRQQIQQFVHIKELYKLKAY